MRPEAPEPKDGRENLLGRVTANPAIFAGKPIIRGMRISVEMILSLLAQGETRETLLADYPELEPEDIRACLAYAHAVIAHDSLEGAEIIVAVQDDAEAPLVPAPPGAQPRTAGLHPGAAWTSDDFDAPLPEDFWTGAS